VVDPGLDLGVEGAYGEKVQKVQKFATKLAKHSVNYREIMTIGSYYVKLL